MAYKQSPFPLIAGTSPLKIGWALKAGSFAFRHGKKVVKGVKNLFTKSKPTITKIPGAGASLTEISQSGMSATQRVQRNLQLAKSTAPITSYTTKPVTEGFKFVNRSKVGKTAVETFKSASGKIKQYTFVDMPSGGPRRLLQSGDISKVVKQAVKP